MGGARGFVGFEQTPLIPVSFDLLVLCYSQQCLNLNKSSPCNSIQLARSELVLLKVELRVASAGFGKGGVVIFNFSTAHASLAL